MRERTTRVAVREALPRDAYVAFVSRRILLPYLVERSLVARRGFVFPGTTQRYGLRPRRVCNERGGPVIYPRDIPAESQDVESDARSSDRWVSGYRELVVR